MTDKSQNPSGESRGQTPINKVVVSDVIKGQTPIAKVPTLGPKKP